MKQPSEWIVTGFDGDSNPIYEERQSHCSYTVLKCMESSSWDSNGKMDNVYGYLYWIKNKLMKVFVTTGCGNIIQGGGDICEQ